MKIKIDERSLQEASRYTENFPVSEGKYVQIDFDRNTGEVLTSFHVSLGQNSWTEYHDPDVIHICTTHRHMSTKAIERKIKKELELLERYSTY